MKKEKKSPNKNQWQKIMLNINVFFVWLKKNKKIVYWVTFGLGLISFIYFQYYGLIHYHYPVPPGDDPMNHYTMAKQFYDGKATFLEVWKAGGYPPFYHYLVAKAAHIFGAEPMKVILWIYPALLVLAALAAFSLAYVGFGPMVGLISFFVYFFLANPPLRLLNDGGYPNLLAASVFMPLAFAGIIWFLKRAGRVRFWGILCFVLFGILTVLTHHISTFEFLVILAVFLPILIIFLWISGKWNWKIGVGILSLLLFLFGYSYWAFFHLSIMAPARGLFEIMFALQKDFPYFKSLGLNSANTSAMWELRTYPNELGKIMVIFGFIGAIFGIIKMIKLEKKTAVLIILLGVWLVILFLGSRMSSLTNPERLGRDMSLPFAILSAYGMYELGKVACQLDKRIFTLLLLILLYFTYPNINGRIVMAKGHEPMVRMTYVDMNLSNELNLERHRLKRPINILSNYYTPYYNYFLPEDNFADLRTFTLQDQELYSKCRYDKAVLNYDYVYMVKNFSGWLPVPLDYSYDKCFEKDNRLIRIADEKSPVNEVVLYKVDK